MIFVSAVALSACTTTSVDDASAEEVSRARYVADGPPSITLFSIINNRTGAGGHSSLMVSGSQRVLFDPAGSFRHEGVVERGDVLYGMSPAWVASYKSAHARDTHHIVSQTVVVTPQQAETALALVEAYGAVPAAFCANATSSILQQVMGFEDIETTFFPENLMAQLSQWPGVVQEEYFENDAGDVRDGLVPVGG